MALSSKRTVAALAGLVAVSFGTVACGGSSDDGSGANGGGSSVAASKIDKTDYSKWCDMKSQLQGKTVTVYASIIGPEGAAQQASYKSFEQCTGVTIKYQGDNDFEKNLPQRAQTGNLPDIAFVPQPGLLQTMVSTGKAIPAPQTVIDEVNSGWSPIWKTYGTVNGTLYAAPLGANVKSYVWYSPKYFKENGYSVPTTWDQMMDLTKKIAAADGSSGAKPWCGGISSGTATGWPATDWLEESMLRTNSVEDYDNWITNKLKFNDPKVLKALNKISDIFKNPAYVNGGHGDVKSIKSTTFQDAGLPILKDQCAMLQQASFYAANWPTGTKVDPDGDVWAFYLPSADSSKPIEGGGEFTVAFRKAPEVQAFQAFLASADWANEKAKATPDGGWVSANKGLKPENLASKLDQQSAKLLQDPDAVFRFDASDLMPSSVGAGTFWTEMTNWILGQSDQTTLDNIQKSWPSS